MRRTRLPIALAAALACASPPDPAWVEVELLRGAAALPEAPAPPGDPRLLVVLDQTESMGSAAGEGEATAAEAARAAATTLLESVPAGSDVALHVLGIAQGRACSPAVRVSAPERARASELLARTVGSLEPRSEGSLAGALRAAGAELRAGGPPEAGRIVVISDFRNDCASDPCAALAELVELGARIDVVALGGAPPACLADLAPAGPPPAAATLTPPPAAALDFRVEAVLDAEAPPVVLAVGQVGEQPIALPSGRAVVVIETEPAFRIGPVELLPGVVTHVRGADFPAADPSWRAWSVSRREAPPPVGSPSP